MALFPLKSVTVGLVIKLKAVVLSWLMLESIPQNGKLVKQSYS